ncbi:hypothetical protein Sdia_35140 [Streptomyces diastaticus subsp. diastaticus]|nr:hypothetical protein Sdia_35140 [Streptomyces diastaticus subsp. diastaticus]GGU45737.1 hypothetical protein GCM10015534_55330 [Streptomyces diastaticus subsp. diastaticus]
MRSAGKAVGRADLRPGDLIVFNADGNWGHVGLYIGNGQMVHAPNPRTPGETASVQRRVVPRRLDDPPSSVNCRFRIEMSLSK